MFGLGLGLTLGNNVAAVSGGGGGAFTPASLPGLALWIEADTTKLYTDAGTTLVSADGQAVQQANDKSGLGNNLSQATLANRPLYKTGSGKPYLQFDGSNDTMVSPTFTAVDGSGQYWIAVAVYFDDPTFSVTQMVANLHIPSNGDILKLESEDSGATLQVLSFDPSNVPTADMNNPVPTATPVVLIATVTSTAVELFKDNVSDGSTALTGTRNTGNPALYVGTFVGSLSPLKGRIYAIVEGTGTLSSTDRANLQTYLAGLHP